MADSLIVKSLIEYTSPRRIDEGWHAISSVPKVCIQRCKFLKQIPDRLSLSDCRSDQDDAGNFSGDERFHLLDLAVGITIGNGFDHLVAASAEIGFDGLKPGDPILGLQRLEGNADGERFVAAGGSLGFLTCGESDARGEGEGAEEDFHGKIYFREPGAGKFFAASSSTSTMSVPKPP